MKRDRRRATGERGEQLAAEHLVRAGYEILERNFRTARGELDLVATDRRAIVFCEVKARIAGTGGPEGPLAGIGRAKRRQLRAMAREWLGCRGPAPGTVRAELRFDAIGVMLAPSGELVRLEHLENAFE